MASAGLVALAVVDRIERDLEHQALVGLAHRAEAVDGVLAHMAVEPFQLLVGEAEIGLADRQQFGALRRDRRPSSRRCSPNRSDERLPLPRWAYISTQSTSSGSRFHLYHSPVLRPAT